ncbi:MFS transporter [Thermotoga sp. RQ7]|uniref:MFS transporter n=1 Tax=Thermotoga sp. RQ7 TaxID=126738 RepID=UPI0005A3366C|nr:MFS transporter [Thermotoga sp. RQ7]AJG41631.1 MFS transporter [Thermotoga sp. RQ7]
MKRIGILLGICLGLTSLSILQGSVFGAVLPSIVEEFGVDWSVMGVAMSAWAVVSALSPMFFGRFVHGLSPMNSIALIMVMLSVPTILVAFVKDFFSLNVVRIVGSVAVPFAYPLAARVVEMYVDPRKRGIATAIYNTGSMIGLALGYVVVALVGGSWKSSMIAGGLLGVIYVPVAYILWNSFLEGKTQRRSEWSGSQKKTHTTFKRVFTIVLWLSLGHFSAVYTWNLMFRLSTFLVREVQLDYGFIALVLGIMAVVSSTLEIFTGLWSDRVRGIRGRLIPLYAGLLPSAVLLILSTLSTSPISTAVMMGLSILFWRLSTPSFWAIFGDLIPPEHFERASNIYVGAVIFSGIASSLVNGYIVSLTGSMKYAILLSASILILSPIFFTVGARTGLRGGRT